MIRTPPVFYMKEYKGKHKKDEIRRRLLWLIWDSYYSHSYKGETAWDKKCRNDYLEMFLLVELL